jgi:protease-4
MAVGLLTIVLGAISLLSLWRTPGVAEHSILEITLDGAISEAPQPQVSKLLGGEEEVPLVTLVERIRRAAEDKRIDGLLLHVKAPEVGLAQAEELGRAMQVFRASNKWSASFLETAGEGSRGDGAYLLAAMANQVILAPPGEINLMGMRTDAPFGKRALEKLHVQAHVEQRYEYKNYAEMFTETGFTPAHRESMVSLLDDLQARICELMAGLRHTHVDTVKAWIYEAPFNSAGALAHHLVDTVGYWDDVEKLATAAAGGREDPFVDIAHYRPKPVSKNVVPVALVVGQGEINRGEGGPRPMGARDHMGSETYTEALRQARADQVRGVLLRIDSPGGSYIASDLIRREVELTRNANIPVVVSMGNVAASGGYFMSIDADHIVAELGTITGSIGVVSVSFAMRQALQHFLGVTFDSYASVQAPGATSFLDPLSGEGLTRMRRDVDRIYEDFVTKVARGRHVTYDDVHKVARGRVWTGRQALARGLIDEVGGMDTALDYLRRRLDLADDVAIELINYPEPESPWSLLRELADGQLAQEGALRSLQPLLAPLTAKAQQLLQGPSLRAQAPDGARVTF